MKNFFTTWGGVLATLVLFVVMLSPVLVGAQIGSDINASKHTSGSGGSTGLPSGGSTGIQSGGSTGLSPGGNTGYPNSGSATGGAGSSVLQNPLGGINSICQLVVKLLQAAIVIGIPIAVLFIVWAGFKFILALGNPGKLTEARKNFLNVIIGIAIFLGASLIAQVIMNTLKGLGVQGINSC